MAEILGVVSGIIAVADLTYKVLGYFKTVHHAGKEIQDYNREAPILNELLTSLAAHVLQNSGHSVDPWFESIQTLQHGPMQQYQVALDEFKKKVVPGTGLREKIRQKMTWNFVKDDLKDILAKMERLKTLIAISLQKDHFKLSEATHSITLNIKDDMAVVRAIGEHQATALAHLKREAEKHADTTSKIRDDTTVIRATGERHAMGLAVLTAEAHKQSAFSSAILQNTSQIGSFRAEAKSADVVKQKAQLLQWLSDHNHIKEQHDHISRYKEGTGMWLLEDPKFKEWKDGTNKTLFCVGMPGAGKTVMSAMVIRHLFRTTRSSDDHVGVAFLYFRYDLRDAQSTEFLLGSLTKQLVDQVEEVPEHIEQAFKTQLDVSEQFEKPTKQAMLQAAVSCFNCVYFVIDALDESAAQYAKGLISAVRLLSNAKIKLFATSRFIPEIQAYFDDSLSIEIRGSDTDIESYTMDRLIELPRCVQNSQDLQEEISQAIVKSTDGMFLLAKLHIDSLKDKRTLKAMRSTLQSLPTGSSAYDAAYDGAMKRITDQSGNDYNLAQKVLTWLVYAMRPISGSELETALAVEVGETHLDPDNVIAAVELLSLCAGLVTLDVKSKSVRLVHYTAQDYFSRNPQHLFQNPHRILSNACISYLGNDDFMDRGYMEVEWKEHLASHVHRYPFLGYAAAHWEDHARSALPPANDEEASQILALDLRLLRHHQLMECYFRARGEWTWQVQRSSPDLLRMFIFERKTGMQYAAAKGNIEQVSALLKLGFDPNDSTHDTTALIEASRRHQESVVRRLIEAKANVHFIAKVSTHTALTAAIGMTGRRDYHDRGKMLRDHCHPFTRALDLTVALLLEAGADPEHVTVDSDDITPLMHAARHGMKTVVAMLRRAGADVNRRGGNDLWMNGGQTALHVAAMHGRETIVNQLLEYGGDPDITDNTRTSPAACAAQGQHWKTLKSLLDSTTIDLNHKTAYGDTILELACRSKDCPDALIKRLLPTSLNCLNSSGRPLIRAAEAQRVVAVRMLLEAGADPYPIDCHGDTALHVLARLDHHDSQHASIVITQALLGANMGVDTRGRNGATALMLASGSGHSDLVLALLRNGANVLLKDDGDWSSITYAAHGGHVGIVKSLLDTEPAQQTALSFIPAASRGHVSVLRVLASAGVDVNLATEDGTTALISASKRGRLDAAEMLIEAGAAVNTRTADGMSPLMFAATWGHKDLMRLLLRSGADANITNRRGETALVVVLRNEMKLEMKSERSRRASALGQIEVLPEGVQEILPMLLDAGVDVNASTHNGETALLVATDPNYPNPDDVELLLKADADPSIFKRTNQSALLPWDRIERMPVLVFESLLRAGVDPNEHDDDGMTALMHLSSRRSQVEKLKILLENGASPDAVNSKGQTALTLAVQKADRNLNPEIVKELLKAGADPNHQDAGGSSVLFHIASRDCLSETGECEQVLKALIDAGGDLFAVSSNYETLIMRSARLASSEMVKMLLDAGADPYGSDKDGRSTILLASMMGDDRGEEAVRLLLDAGVDPSTRDHSGNNALMVAAKSSGSPITLRRLLSAGMDPHERTANGLTMLMLVASSQGRDVYGKDGHDDGSRDLSVLIEYGVGVDLRDNKGNTALMYAAEHNWPVGPLLAAGADPNLANTFGHTALIKFFLGGGGISKTIFSLIDAGADVNMADKTGRNVLIWAAVGTQGGARLEALEQVLSARNLDLDHLDNNGETALECSVRVGNNRIADMIRAEFQRRKNNSELQQGAHRILQRVESPLLLHRTFQGHGLVAERDAVDLGWH